MNNVIPNCLDTFSASVGVRLSPRLFAAFEIIYAFRWNHTITRQDLDFELGGTYDSRLITRAISLLVDNDLLMRKEKGTYINLTQPSNIINAIASKVCQYIKGKGEFTASELLSGIISSKWAERLPAVLDHLQEQGKVQLITADRYMNLESKESDTLFETVSA